MNQQLPLSTGHISYSLQGSGPVLLLVHGFAFDRTIWEGLLPELSAGYRVLCIDLPGFGDSTLDQPYSMDRLADVFNAVLVAEGIAECVLIGHSMGGYAALAFAARFPDKLRGIGLCHSHPFADSPAKKENRRRSGALIEKRGHERFVREMIPNLFADSFAKAHPGLIAQLTERALSFPAAAYTTGLEAMSRRPDRAALLAAFPQLPWLFIIGEADDFVPLDALKEAALIPDIASVVLLPSVGHMSMFEAPQQIGQRIKEFADLCYRYLPV